MNQIQTTMQRASEMKEKIRILSNEIEILRHEITIRERELQVHTPSYLYISETEARQ